MTIITTTSIVTARHDMRMTRSITGIRPVSSAVPLAEQVMLRPPWVEDMAVVIRAPDVRVLNVHLSYSPS
ncbi:hypothetical protein H351_31275 (plasmid) [Rhodococcus erythropolis R138]|nr:hypothetical protein H351_31275 [Rhodococcus erythropolis R138]